MAKNGQRYKLVYFDLRGLAETSRMVFAYAGVEYEDSRINREDWQSMKDKTPFHSLPYLEVDGDVIGQSNAIARFLAKRFNLAGHSDVEQAHVDAISDYVNDARQGLILWFRETDEERKKTLKEKYFGETVHECLDVFEKHLKNNSSNSGFFVGNGPTWADFNVASAMLLLESVDPDVLKKHPALKEHQERVQSLKGIKEWVAKRPKTTM